MVAIPQKRRLRGHPLYSSWAAMLDRCRNPNNKSYKNYGGRGIRVCERWHSFAAFLEDMGERPEGCTLDRIDNNGNYEASNCRWATWNVQNNNNRHKVYLTYNGKTLGLKEWSKEPGTVSLDTMYHSHADGLSTYEILFGRIRKNGRQNRTQQIAALLSRDSTPSPLPGRE